MTNVRRTLAIKIATPGGDNPLRLAFVAAQAPYFAGVAVSGLSLVARGGTAPYAYSILDGGDSNGEIAGLTVHTDGTFTGTPDQAGHFPFVAQVTDSEGDTFPHSFSLNISAPIEWVRFDPRPGEALLAYSYRMLARDLAGNDITSGYTVASGNLPAGLSLNTNGTISGTPTFPSAVGTSYATIRVTHGGYSSDISISIRVYDPLLAFGTEITPTFYVGVEQSYSIFQAEAPSGGLEPYRVRIDNLADYPWLKFNTAALTLTGTSPFENIGVRQEITFTLYDALGASVSSMTFPFIPIFAQGGLDIGSGGKITPSEDGFVAIESNDGSIAIEPSSSAGGLNVRAKLFQPRVRIETEDPALLADVPADYFDLLGDFQDVPVDGTITGWEMTCNIPGSASITISRCSRDDYPVFTDMFTASISSDVLNSASGLSHAFFKGDFMRARINDLSDFNVCYLQMKVA